MHRAAIHPLIGQAGDGLEENRLGARFVVRAAQGFDTPTIGMRKIRRVTTCLIPNQGFGLRSA